MVDSQAEWGLRTAGGLAPGGDLTAVLPPFPAFSQCSPPLSTPALLSKSDDSHLGRCPRLSCMFGACPPLLLRFRTRSLRGWAHALRTRLICSRLRLRLRLSTHPRLGPGSETARAGKRARGGGQRNAESLCGQAGRRINGDGDEDG